MEHVSQSYQPVGPPCHADLIPLQGDGILNVTPPIYTSIDRSEIHTTRARSTEGGSTRPLTYPTLPMTSCPSSITLLITADLIAVPAAEEASKQRSGIAIMGAAPMAETI